MAAASSTRVMSEVRASRARVIVVGGIAQALYAACVLMAYNVVGGETARRCEQINCDAGDRFGAGALWLLAVLPLLYLVGSALTIASLTLCVARLPRYGIVAAAGTAAALFGVPVVVFTAPALHAMEVLIPPLPITLAAIVALDSAARPARADATSALPTSPDDVSRVRAWPSD